ncbi:uncharacterized protein C8A04DRAFT_14488 [Dichotomopilus funicola]|uniref:DUF7924 domain-containing protein n=1 Tax=Dichotomopilus funicola TaxID=1934379 RepID=A0AAN6UYR1_9PEZI|nr:hypothetical protein C8A04DRAFT_14488 [Dichotomopilus funicola]
MNGGVSKPWTRRSRAEISKALQGTLLDAVTNNAAEPPRSHREQSRESGDLAGDVTPVQARKGRLDMTTESDPVPAKQARLTWRDSQPPEVEDKEVDDKVWHQSPYTSSQLMWKLVQTTVRQPTPSPPRRPYPPFLKDFVDPVHSSPCPASVHAFVSEWLESVDSDREKHCPSDSHLHHSEDDLVPRQLTRSAPEMGHTKDADGFTVPPLPASTGSRSDRASPTGSVAPSGLTGATSGPGRSSGKSLVEDPSYRRLDLAANNIYMRDLHEQFPEHIADLVDHVHKDRDSPGPSSDEVRQDTELNELWMGAGESRVEAYFRRRIFPEPEPGDGLVRDERQPMPKHAVPSAGSSLKVSTPVPDILYGYHRKAFPQQQTQLISMRNEMLGNNQGLMYPFFVIEFKGDGPTSSGSFWVATNQCLGGSTSCVNIAEHLNHHLMNYKSNEVLPINSAAFSIAMSGTEARLYISWKHNELDYYMANVKGFLLYEPEHYIEFRKYVRNIIDWGKDKRLKEIRDSLDTLLEKRRQRASEGRFRMTPFIQPVAPQT